MNIILSTRNPSKTEQIKAVFNGMPLSILTLNETEISGEAIEDGRTLRENAYKKAKYALKYAPQGYWTMADDTGLFISALNGEPGIMSARWLGQNATTEDTMNYCLRRLEGIQNRSAFFETDVILLSPHGQEYFFSGRAFGKILEHPRVQPQKKMPYSPIFQPEGSDKTWAEMAIEEENEISHRGKAFSQVRQFLEKLV